MKWNEVQFLFCLCLLPCWLWSHCSSMVRISRRLRRKIVSFSIQHFFDFPLAHSTFKQWNEKYIFHLFLSLLLTFFVSHHIAGLVNCSMSTIERFNSRKREGGEIDMLLTTELASNNENAFLSQAHLCWIFIEILYHHYNPTTTIRFFDCVIIILIFYSTSAEPSLSPASELFCCKGFSLLSRQVDLASSFLSVLHSKVEIMAR